MQKVNVEKQKNKKEVPVAVVNRIAESGCVDYGQCQVDSVFFQKSLALFDLRSLKLKIIIISFIFL